MFVSATEIQNNFGKYLKLCRVNNIIITKNGKNRAVLVHYTRSSEDDEAGEPSQIYGTSPKKSPAAKSASRPAAYVTYKQFQDFVEASENRYELIDGMVYLQAFPGFTHQKVVMSINDEFRAYFNVHERCDAFAAPLDIELIRQPVRLKRDTDEDDINIVQPDIVVLCDYQDDIDEKDRYRGIPTLVVEVLSPSTSSMDRIRKLSLYMESGIGEYWIVDPGGKKIMVYAFKDFDLKVEEIFTPGSRAESYMFPGLGIDVGSLW
jgi:prevent-host-death family protein